MHNKKTMEQKNKIRLLSWLLLFVVIIDLGIIGTMLYQHYKYSKQYPYQYHRFKTRYRRMPQGMRHFKDILIHELKMTPEQIKEYSVIRQEFIRNAHSKFDSIHICNQKIDSLLQYDNPDMQRINNCASQIGSLNKSLKISFVNYYIQIEKILNPKQKKKFRKIFKKFKNRRRRK
jgi:Spy/CpxP family protein refolding chaperone